MSATPRTDALDRQLAGFNAFKNLSSDLEAELAAAIARISELESHVRTDNSAVIARLEAERDAAFKMSRCECGPEECCANLAKLHAEIATLKETK
jgi:hypothetical protein